LQLRCLKDSGRLSTKLACGFENEFKYTFEVNCETASYLLGHGDEQTNHINLRVHSPVVDRHSCSSGGRPATSTAAYRNKQQRNEDGVPSTAPSPDWQPDDGDDKYRKPLVSKIVVVNIIISIMDVDDDDDEPEGHFFVVVGQQQQ
jgi:hypothetical protein